MTQGIDCVHRMEVTGNTFSDIETATVGSKINLSARHKKANRPNSQLPRDLTRRGDTDHPPQFDHLGFERSVTP
ncbi:hypothetical protein J6590_034145 [Homalodisca vitripennis]|nr:hypothetical protein J6590_034145 [Homalodisca vitripennis]